MNGVICLRHRLGDMLFLRDTGLPVRTGEGLSRLVAGDIALVPGTPGLALSEKERERSSRFAIAHRRDEWLLGRMAARAAIAALLGEGGYEVPVPSALEIIAGEDGAPRVMWLKESGLPGVSLTLTHQGGWAAAWAAFDEPAVTRGIDLEAIQPREPGLVEQFFAEEEQRWLAGLGRDCYEWGVNVVWSLKEAALKALKVGLRADTRAIRVREVYEDGRADLVLDPSISGGLNVLSAFWDRHREQVLTRVMLGNPVLSS